MSQDRRQALVAYLAAKEGQNGRLGKKAAQKFIYLLSSLSKRNYGYSFSFYTYGPFSRELASDLDLMNAQGCLVIRYNNFENAYSISAGPRADHMIKNYLTEDVRRCADSIWEKFSGRTAKELELLSTILFVHDEERLPLASEAMADRVNQLKPKYSGKEIASAQRELRTLVR